MKITNPQNISGQPLLTQVAVSGGHLSGAGTTGSPLTVGGYVETTTTVNGKALSSNVTVTALDVPMSSEQDAPTVQAKISAIEQQITGSGNVTVSPVTYAGNPVSSIVQGANVSMSYSSGALTINATASSMPIDSALSSSSVNAVQNKAVYSAVALKADSSHTHAMAQVSGLTNVLDNLIVYPTSGASGYYLEKTGTKTALWRAADSSLNSTSIRPVQNKAVYAKTSAIEASISSVSSSASSIDARVSAVEQQLDGIAALLSGI